MQQWNIKCVRKIVEAHANTRIPYQCKSPPDMHGRGEAVSFDTPTVVKLVVGACGLRQAAKEQPLCKPQSCDTANITKTMSICMYSF
jgi:hypothetical protein